MSVKLLVLFSCLCLLVASEKIIDYDAGNARHVQYGVPGKSVQGEYSYKSPDGRSMKVSYVADENGFQASTNALEEVGGQAEGRALLGGLGAGLAGAGLASIAGLTSLSHPRPQPSVSSIALIGVPVSYGQAAVPSSNYVSYPQHGGYYQGMYGQGLGNYVQGVSDGTYVSTQGSGTGIIQGATQGILQSGGQEVLVHGAGQGVQLQGTGQGLVIHGTSGSVGGGHLPGSVIHGGFVPGSQGATFHTVYQSRFPGIQYRPLVTSSLASKLVGITV